jgi:ribosomal protein S18 acetylase RimI-like enzyme
MAEIRPLTNCSIETIHKAFLQAFSDYSVPFQLQQHELEYMLHRRGFEPSLSYGAFAGDSLVAFTLNCTGTWNGLPTAYDTGTGTIPQYRRQGLGAAIFEASIPVLKMAGMQQYLLEVMQDNTRAIELYRAFGFGVVRGFDTYYTSKDTIATRPLPVGYHMETLSRFDPELRSLWRIEPSWQNANHSILRAWQSMTGRAVYAPNGEIVAYALLTPATGDVPQLAVASGHRRMGLATALLAHLKGHTNAPNLRVANVESSYEPFSFFATQSGMLPGPKQYEMLLRW